MRLYENLFSVSNPGDERKNPEVKEVLNPSSVEVLDDCRIELSMATNKAYDHYQFLRLGYFCYDSSASESDCLVFNRTVTLRDSWAKARK